MKIFIVTNSKTAYTIYIGTHVLQWKIDYVLNDFYFDKHHLMTGYFTPTECVLILEYCKNNLNLIIKHLDYTKSKIKDQLINKIENDLYPEWLIRNI